MGTTRLTLCFIQEPERILLAMKKRGFGAGRYNGYGGKIKNSESIEESAKREILEESGIKAEVLKKQAILIFTSTERPDEILETHVYRIVQYTGEPVETEEMKPDWFTTTDIPYSSMWPDDEYWLPLFLDEKHFIGHFHFGKDDQVIEKNVEEMSADEFLHRVGEYASKRIDY